MGLCKHKKVTNLFCFQHRKNVCPHCLTATTGEHRACRVRSYLQWLQDNDFDPNCSICHLPLLSSPATTTTTTTTTTNTTGSGEVVRLGCLDVFHVQCLNGVLNELAQNTALAGYTCPLCNAPILQPPSQQQPHSASNDAVGDTDLVYVEMQRVLRESGSATWARAFLATSTTSTTMTTTHMPSRLNTNTAIDIGTTGSKLRSPTHTTLDPLPTSHSGTLTTYTTPYANPNEDPDEGDKYDRRRRYQSRLQNHLETWIRDVGRVLGGLRGRHWVWIAVVVFLLWVLLVGNLRAPPPTTTSTTTLSQGEGGGVEEGVLDGLSPGEKLRMANGQMMQRDDDDASQPNPKPDVEADGHKDGFLAVGVPKQALPKLPIPL